MKKLFICLLLFLFSCTAVSADDINGVGNVNADKLNVRALPAMDANVIGSLSNGTKVNVITKTSRTWYKIDFNGQTGFVHSDYLRVSRNEPPVVRIKATDQSLEGMKMGEKVVAFAKQYLGVPYVWGGASEFGFDCSGFVYYVYNQFGKKLNRVAAEQAENGIQVDLENLEPGDLVFFWNKESYSEINHVGIYVGSGMFIHSPQTGDVVKISSLESGYYKNTLYTARRIFE